MKAIFQGEFHISSADGESLKEKLDSDTDALFIEQREDRVSPEEWTLGYLVFLVGVLSLYWLQEQLYSGPDVSEDTDVPVHDEIDTNLPDLYQRIPPLWIWVSGLIACFAFLYGLFIPNPPIPLVDAPWIASYIYTAILKPVLVTGSPLLFSFLLIVYEERYIGGRDEDMANAITETSRDNGYQRVVISCGDAHLDRLSDLLEEKDWEVEIHESNHGWIPDVWR